MIIVIVITIIIIDRCFLTVVSCFVFFGVFWFFFGLFMLSGFIPFFLQDALNSHSHHFLDSLDRAQIHGTNILLPQEPRGSIICSSFQSPGSRFQPGRV